MKKKLEITFEVKTTVEVDIPEVYGETCEYVVAHKDEITETAKQVVLKEGVEPHLVWDNLFWCEHTDKEGIDVSSVGFEL